MREVLVNVLASIIGTIIVSILLTFKKLYPAVIDRLTLCLLEDTLKVDSNDKNRDKEKLKIKILERVTQEQPAVQQKQNDLITEFENQIACEDQLKESFRSANMIKILTIRGAHYFLGHRSLFYDLCEQKLGCHPELCVKISSKQGGKETRVEQKT